MTFLVGIGMPSQADTIPTYITQWGYSGSYNGQLANPESIAVSADGNLYVADTGNNRIQEFTSTGAFVTEWDSSDISAGKFNYPVGVAVGTNGNVYVADYWNYRILVFTSSGKYVKAWTSFGTDNDKFSQISDITVDSSGNVWVIDNYRILEFTSSGALVNKWGSWGDADNKFAYNPSGIAVDSGGNVYVIEGNKIKKFTSAGTLIKKWGDYGSEEGQLNNPRGIVVDSSGTVYVADTGNNRIQMFTSSGDPKGKWGPYGISNTEFSSPKGIAVDSSGTVYVADTGNNLIKKFFTFTTSPSIPKITHISPSSGPITGGTLLTITGSGFNEAISVNFDSTSTVNITTVSDSVITVITPANSPGTVDVTISTPGGVSAPSTADQYTYTGSLPEFVTMKGTSGSGDSQFNSLSEVAVSANGNVYAADTGNNRIQMFTSNLTYVKNWDSSETSAGKFSYPVGVAVGTNGNVYVADYWNYRILVFTSSGTYVKAWTSFGTDNDKFSQISDITVDSSGNVWVIDNYRILEFTSSGALVNKWGSWGNADNKFGNNPSGIAIDSGGNFYVIDGNRIRKFTSTGKYVMNWGSPGSGDGQFNSPKGIAVDSSGTVYVADTGNNRIERFSSSGVYEGKWVSYEISNSKFSGPRGIAVDSKGNIYVADTGNNRIEIFYVPKPTPTPTVTGVSPTSGSTAGGTVVTITGTGFTGATAVTFGSTSATNFTVVSATQIKVTSPAGTAGTVDVTVTTPSGTSAKSSTDQYKYTANPVPVPPGSINGLCNTTYLPTSITWTWTDPSSAEFSKVMIYLDGQFKTNVTKGVGTYTASSLIPDTQHTIATHTVGTTGLINQTWVNGTARTAPIAPSSGSISIQSNPSGAEIYLDGTDTGFITPKIITSVSIGSHVIKCSLIGYTDNSQTTTVSAGQTASVNIDLSAPSSTGSISIQSNPTGAKIYLDDADTGFVTPNTILNVPAGSHNIRCSLGGYTDNSQTTMVSAGQTASVNIDLAIVPSTGSVSIQSNPTGAKIYLDEADTGFVTPKTIVNVPTGSHNIRCSLGGYIDNSQTVSVSIGQTANVMIVLQPGILVPKSDFSASPISGSSPLNVKFTDKSTNSPTSWLWTFGDGSTSTEQNPTHIYLKPGMFSVKLKVSNPSGTNGISRSNYIVVSTGPKPTPTTPTPTPTIPPLSNPVIVVDQSSTAVTQAVGTIAIYSPFAVTNEGSAALTYTITEQVPWLSISSGGSGTVSPNGKSTVEVQVDTHGLEKGHSYWAVFTVDSNDPFEEVVPVLFRVTVS
jgi:sugar lactone lactonase YvrE/PKD repeat protein